MSKILFSWNATENDFIYDGDKENKKVAGVRSDGIHGEFYHYFLDYDEHYLLNSKKNSQQDKRLMMLSEFLSSYQSMKIKPTYMNLEDAISVGEIKQKIEELLIPFKNHQLEAFISPGTPAMQTAWYLIGREFRFDLKLFFIRPPWKRKTKQPIREYVEFEKTEVIQSTLLREAASKRNWKFKNQEIIRNSSNIYAYDLADKVAITDKVTALILGESGTGKEVVTHYIHNNSKRGRSKKPLVAINCAAYSDELLESRLFGHEKGSFTGAVDKQIGAFEQANGGTIFLDEIGDISKKMQQTLLRVLSEDTIKRVGSQKEIKVDVRIITATNKDLWQMVQDGDFRMDLFFRLDVATITLPPLRSYAPNDKKDLITQLHKHIAYKTFGRKPLIFSDQVWSQLFAYSFSGNIRELVGLIERWFTYCGDGKVELADFPIREITSDNLMPVTKLKDVERLHIQRILKLYPHSKKQCYEALGIQYNTFEKKLKEYCLKFGE